MAADSVHALKDKLGGLATGLSIWDRETFGSVRQEIKNLKEQLDMLRSQPTRAAPSHMEVKITDRLIELYHREEILWRQRARLDWLVHGDKNTYFFHLRASRRRRKNQIKALTRPDGSLTEDKAELENITTEFYKTLYTSEGVNNMEEVLQHVPVKVTPAMNNMLNAPYQEEEVKRGLFQMFPTKAPGPDGFPAHFSSDIGIFVGRR